MTLRMMTMNIYSGRDVHQNETIDLTGYIAHMKAVGPDIVILNEVRGDTLDDSPWGQTTELQQGLGLPYKAFAHGIHPKGLGPYGNAILSAFPILNQRRIEIPDPPKDARTGTQAYESRVVLAVEILVPQGYKIAVFGTHFGLNTDEHEAGVATVLDLLAHCPDPWIFGGDLNMTPECEGIQTLAARYRDVAAVAGHPEPTFPSHAPVDRIDYLFVSDHWTVQSVRVPEESPSDHRAVLAILDRTR